MVVYQRGGTIVPRKHRIRRSSALMHDDPITLHIAVNRDVHTNAGNTDFVKIIPLADFYN